MSRNTQSIESGQFDKRASLLYSYKNSKSLFSATLCSCSAKELRIETGYAIKPETDLYFMFEELPRNRDDRKRYHAKVKWCIPLENTDAFFYFVGLEVYDSIPCQS